MPSLEIPGRNEDFPYLPLGFFDLSYDFYLGLWFPLGLDLRDAAQTACFLCDF